jgi:hypothetical protein
MNKISLLIFWTVMGLCALIYVIVEHGPGIGLGVWAMIFSQNMLRNAKEKK